MYFPMPFELEEDARRDVNGSNDGVIASQISGGWVDKPVMINSRSTLHNCSRSRCVAPRKLRMLCEQWNRNVITK